MENPKDRREKVPKLGNLNKSEPAKQLEQVNPTHAENSYNSLFRRAAFIRD